MIAVRLVLVAACLGGLASCGPAAPPATPASREYPCVLAPPEALAPDFSVRQHVTAEAGGKSGSFDAVLQKRGAELVIVGLVAGVRAFVLKQTAAGITYDQSFGPKLPFAPRDVVVDVHRAYFKRLPRAPGERPTGTLRGRLDGEKVEEDWKDGHLVERRFFRPGEHKGAVRVTYDEGCTVERCAPRRLRIENEWFAYAIKIDSDEYDFF
jgi:hypothetical protein